MTNQNNTPDIVKLWYALKEEKLTAALDASDANAECDCGNAANYTLENGSPACEFCAYHEGHVAPDSVSTGYAHLSGAFVATCNLCDFVCAYWDCACELEHDCVDNDK